MSSFDFNQEIKTINNNFDCIKTLRLDLNQIFIEIENKMNALSKIYIKLIKTHQNIDYTFGLDSFHFQNRLIEIEYENIKQIFNSINNRMYCEYYKLYKILQDYINTEIKDDSILEHIQNKKTFPKYNDIEPLKKYEFSLILEIQQLIVKILQLLHEHYTSKQKALETN